MPRHSLPLYHSGDKEPRPFGPSHHGTRPNDLIQFDYIEMGHSTASFKYLLMVRDDFFILLLVVSISKC